MTQNDLKDFILIDDDPANNLLCKAVIKKTFLDADVKSFLLPEEGLTYLQKNFTEDSSVNTKIIFLDINMPEMSGWELLDEFEKLPDNTKSQFKIYMLSSSIDLQDKQKAVNNKLVAGFISKPLKQATLKEIFELED